MHVDCTGLEEGIGRRRREENEIEGERGARKNEKGIRKKGAVREGRHDPGLLVFILETIAPTLSLDRPPWRFHHPFPLCLLP